MPAVQSPPWTARRPLKARSAPPHPSAVPQDISELCNECSSLIENHDKIRVLSAVHYNLGKTLQDVSNISDLPAMAEDAEKLLSNNELLLQASMQTCL